MTYLTRILEVKKEEVAALRRENPERRYEKEQAALPPVRDFRGAITPGNGTLSLIAEIKKASPSRGIIVHDFNPLRMAADYEAMGASAFSVLTETRFFQGSTATLRVVHSATSLPVLRKDFTVDASQLFESRLIGADAILLIVAALDAVQLHDFLQIADAIGLHALVEVHDGLELDTAMKAGATIIGINNRNLRDFTVDLNTSCELRRHIPAGLPAVAESGMKTTSDLALIHDAAFDAVLIGEGLHISPELRSLTWPLPGLSKQS